MSQSASTQTAVKTATATPVAPLSQARATRTSPDGAPVGRKVLRMEEFSKLRPRPLRPGELRQTATRSTRTMAAGATAAAYAHVIGRELDARERGIVRRIAFIAKLMDNAVRVPGTQVYVGLDPLIGLVPGYGDWFSCGVSIYVLIEAIRLGTPPDVLAKMALNVGVDIAVGFVPGLGDVFDLFFKANARNAQLIQRDVLGLPEAPGNGDPAAAWTALSDALDAADASERDAEQGDDAEQVEGALVVASAPRAEVDRAEAAAEGEAEDAEWVEAHAPQAALEPAWAHLPARRARRESTPLQQAIGYTLVAGLVSMFLLPWAVMGYIAYLMAS